MANDEYLCLTVRGRAGEAPAVFKTRLSQVWTGLLRDRKDTFEQVYAETAQFEDDDGQPTRQYLVAESATEAVLAALAAAGVDTDPVDHGELFSKYEAAPPEWVQIEH